MKIRPFNPCVQVNFLSQPLKLTVRYLQNLDKMRCLWYFLQIMSSRYPEVCVSVCLVTSSNFSSLLADSQVWRCLPKPCPPVLSRPYKHISKHPIKITLQMQLKCSFAVRKACCFQQETCKTIYARFKNVNVQNIHIHFFARR